MIMIDAEMNGAERAAVTANTGCATGSSGAAAAAASAARRDAAAVAAASAAGYEAAAAKAACAELPRPEYPRPQLDRGEGSWVNLNGKWEFEFDHGNSGVSRKLFAADAKFGREIVVPFCPESKLSGIGYKDFMRCVWYRRRAALPEAWDLAKGRVLLHFGAVDYFAQVWVNDDYAGGHKGGYASFQLDITEQLRKAFGGDLNCSNPDVVSGSGERSDGVNRDGGENTGSAASRREFRLTVRAEDDTRSLSQPSGKQCFDYYSGGCSYTRTTGIWQTVWLEYVPAHYIRHLFLTPDVANEKLNVRIRPARYFAAGSRLKLTVRDNGRELRTLTAATSYGETSVDIPMPGATLWEPGKPYLYDLDIELTAPGQLTDRVLSYFGMRSVEVTPKCILINGKKVFQRLILDQGFYPDGVYTAPDDSKLRADVERSMAYGFNGARLHQKVVEQRFLYWADRLGYLCWGEHANWGYTVEDPAVLGAYVNEWSEIVERDYSNPSIIGWCPFNETTKGDDTIGTIYRLTKRLDPTRPVIDTSGWFHHMAPDNTSGTDVFDFHDYDQVASSLAEKLRPYSEGKVPPHAPITDVNVWRPDTPYFCSEFGGIFWGQTDEDGWGYGIGPATKEEYIERFGSLVTVLLNDPDLCAFCYTQLTDVEQEKNGLYTYRREAKFPPEVLRKFVAAEAAIERQTD